ncbi:MAG: hypothetical protein LC135_10445 [Phycisphaerae bacterium]|jgi:hypothetical protein|nr:hypothetical protein [Phycisphaerae bacterium]MCZ2400267.1 hypothetical protein [Phycisphaerae bacterium]NUQ49329.1 hypothetical protein [Phycisphaerae bacterium]
MRKTLTTLRCVPRFGYDNTEVRIVELEVGELDHDSLLESLQRWFAMRGISDAVFDIDADDDGYFAIINDEVYAETWGRSLL